MGSYFFHAALNLYRELPLSSTQYGNVKNDLYDKDEAAPNKIKLFENLFLNLRFAALFVNYFLNLLYLLHICMLECSFILSALWFNNFPLFHCGMS